MPSYGVGDRGGIALAAFLQNITFDMHEIDLSNNGLRDQSMAAILEALKSMPDLERLVLSDNSFGPSALSNFVSLITQTERMGLTELHLSNCKLRGHDVDEVLSLVGGGKMPFLQTMDLSNNDLSKSERGLSKLIEANIGTLTNLDISWGHLAENEALPVAQSLEKNSSLVELNLGMNHFGALKVCDALCSALGKNQRLKCLNLENNVMTEASAHVLAHRLISRKTALKMLDISGNRLGDAGAKDIFIEIVMNQHRTLDVPMRLCTYEVAKHATTLDKNLVVVEKESDSSGFSLDFPDAKYRLDLSMPHGRLAAVQLQALAFYHQSFPGRQCWQNVKYNRKSCTDAGFDPGKFAPFKLPMRKSLVRKGAEIMVEECENAEEKVPCRGILEFDYLMQKPRTSEQLPKERTVWVCEHIRRTRAEDPRLARAMLIAICEHFAFDAASARALVDIFDDDLQAKVIAVKSLSVKVVDRSNASLLMSALNELEQKQARTFLGNYFYFDSANPTGHYKVDLSDRYDRLLAIELTAINREERQVVMKEGRPDLSQHHNYEFLRNVFYTAVGSNREKSEPVELKYTNDYLLPSNGLLEFDYVSPIRPPDVAEALSDDEFDAFIRSYVTLQGMDSSHQEKEASEEELRDIFEKIDADGGGTLDVDEIRQVFISLGHDMSREDVEAMIAQVDQGGGGDDDSEGSGDGEVDFDEFRDLWSLFNMELARKDRLSLLRSHSALHWFEAHQIATILRQFEAPEERIEVYTIFYGRLLDEENMHFALGCMGGPLTPPRPPKPELKTASANEQLSYYEENGKEKPESISDEQAAFTKEEEEELATFQQYKTELEDWKKTVHRPWLKQQNKELEELKKRLGPLSMCNPTHLDGSYHLDMRQYDQRLVARIIVKVAAAEGVGNVLFAEEYNDMGFSSSKWAEKGEPPLIGRWKCTFKTNKKACRMDVRNQIAEDFLGWEFPPEEEDEED
jgi:Ran GTPase-activating protein (RanGAP) involved in mRNA processing and transport